MGMFSGLILGGATFWTATTLITDRVQEPWNDSALTASFTDAELLRAGGDSVRLCYRVQNTILVDYRLDDAADVTVVVKRPGSGRVTSAVHIEPFFVPAQGATDLCVRLPHDVLVDLVPPQEKVYTPEGWDFSGIPNANVNARNRFEAAMERLPPAFEGIVVYDDRYRYRIQLPKVP